MRAETSGQSLVKMYLIIRGLGFKEHLFKNHKKLLKDAEFLSYTIAKIDGKIYKFEQEIREEKNEYKRNRLKNVLHLATVASLLVQFR